MLRPLINQKLMQNDYSVLAAEEYINLFHHLSFPTESQTLMLASAHHTLSNQTGISCHRAKMHSNIAITLLQNMKIRNKSSALQLANAYYKRAELLEQEKNFQAASHDYQRTVELLEYNAARLLLGLPEKMLLAQTSIAIADLLLKEQISSSHLIHPYALFYINKALEYLAKIPKNQDSWSLLAYAHHRAGWALSSWAMVDALEAYRTAILFAMKATTQDAANILGEIYKSLGKLYQNYFLVYPIQKIEVPLENYANIYFSLAIFFNSSKANEQEEFQTIVDDFFDTIYLALDPFVYPLPSNIMRDFIDALIYIYYCLVDQTLPNQALCQKLAEPELLSTFAQHIYWLVYEDFRRDNTDFRLLEITNPETVDANLEIGDSIGSILEKDPNNIIMFKKSELERVT